MARRPSEGTCGGSHDRNCFGDHWLIRIALLPAALTLAAIGITEVIAFGTGISWTLPDPEGMQPTRGADDYVEGLARLGNLSVRPTVPNLFTPHSVFATAAFSFDSKNGVGAATWMSGANRYAARQRDHVSDFLQGRICRDPLCELSRGLAEYARGVSLASTGIDGSRTASVIAQDHAGLSRTIKDGYRDMVVVVSALLDGAFGDRFGHRHRYLTLHQHALGVCRESKDDGCGSAGEHFQAEPHR